MKIKRWKMMEKIQGEALEGREKERRNIIIAAQ